MNHNGQGCLGRGNNQDTRPPANLQWAIIAWNVAKSAEDPGEAKK